MSDNETRGGHNRTRCTALTNEGHRCTNNAKPGRDICGTHLRRHKQRDLPKPDPTTQTGQQLIRMMGERQAEAADLETAMGWLVAVIAGQITETQQTGGEGGLVEVPAKIRDRIAAMSIWYRMYRETTGETTDEENVIEQLRSVMGLDS